MTNQRRNGRRETVRTEDPHEAEAVIAEAYLPNRVDPLGTGAARVRVWTRCGLTRPRSVSSRSVPRRGSSPPTRRDYHVNLPLHGGVVSRMGGGAETVAVPGLATVFMPGRPANILWGADALQLCLMIPAPTLVEELEQLLGRSVSGSTGLRDRDGPLHSNGTRLARLAGGVADRAHRRSWAGVAGARGPAAGAADGRRPSPRTTAQLQRRP